MNVQTEQKKKVRKRVQDIELKVLQRKGGLKATVILGNSSNKCCVWTLRSITLKGARKMQLCIWWGSPKTFLLQNNVFSCSINSCVEFPDKMQGGKVPLKIHKYTPTNTNKILYGWLLVRYFDLQFKFVSFDSVYFLCYICLPRCTP